MESLFLIKTPATTKARPDASPSTAISGERSGQKNRWRRWLFEVVPFLVLLPLFGAFAWTKAERSNSGFAANGEHLMFDYDQHAYMNMGRLMLAQNYQRVVPRHRMPGFSFLLSLLYRDADAYPIDPTGKDPRGVSDGYFERCKWFSILCAAASLVMLYGVCRRFLPMAESHLITWSFGWLLAVIRAPYVQPEVIFYVLFLIALILLWRMLVRPTWLLAVAAGLTLAAGFILKSTVIPLIALFLGVSLVHLGVGLWRWARNRSGIPGQPREALLGFAKAVAVPLVFGVVLSPYLRNTAEMHGSAFWDVHSQHYMWMDDDQEKRFWRNAGIADPDFVAPAGQEVPSLKKYLSEHTFAQMLQRLKEGRSDLKAMIKVRYNGVYDLTKKWLLPVLAILAILFRRQTVAAFRAHWMEFLLVVGFFCGYGLLYCWYQAIGVGPRLFLALFLPALFFSVLGIHRLTRWVSFSLRGRPIPLRHVLNVVMLMILVFQSVQLLTGDYLMIEGGR